MEGGHLYVASLRSVVMSRIIRLIGSKKSFFSSIRRNLGLHSETETIRDLRVADEAKLIIDVRDTFDEPLTKEKPGWLQMQLAQNTSLLFL